MPKVKRIEVREGLEELKKVHKKAAYHLKPRLKMLIVAVEKDLHSKRQLAAALGVDRNSVQHWKAAYATGGLEALLGDERGGKRPSAIPATLHKALAKKLTHPTEAPRSFKELQHWVQEYYLPTINYQTLRGYVIRHFGAKLKVVRKSHVHKDEQAVQEFKKK
jgi:transposase